MPTYIRLKNLEMQRITVLIEEFTITLGDETYE